MDEIEGPPSRVQGALITELASSLGSLTESSCGLEKKGVATLRCGVKCVMTATTTDSSTRDVTANQGKKKKRKKGTRCWLATA